MAFSPSPYSRSDLFVAVRDILRDACPGDPASVTTRAFDPARAPAGHPHCPTAKVICYERLHMSWPEVKAIALDPERDLGLTVATRYTSVAADRKLTLAEAVLALRTVALRLGRKSLAEPEYTVESELMLRADRRAYRHGGLLELPTADQIARVAGSWAKALAAAGLEESGRRDLPSLSIEEALDRHLEQYGFVPTMKGLRRFAAAEGIRVQALPRRWRVLVAEWRECCARVGILVPPQPKPIPEIDYGPPVAWELTNRLKRKWTDDELVASLVRAWERLRPGEELTERRYMTLRESDKRLPSSNTFRWGDHLGFAHYRDLARRARFVALGAS